MLPASECEGWAVIAVCPAGLKNISEVYPFPKLSVQKGPELSKIEHFRRGSTSNGSDQQELNMRSLFQIF